MTSEKRSSKGSDAEYQYADETLEQESSIESPQAALAVNSIKDKVRGKFSRQKIGLIALIAIGIFVAYKFFSVSTPATPNVEKTLSQPLAKPAESAPIVAPVSTPAPPPPAAVTSQPLSELSPSTPAVSSPSPGEIQDIKGLQDSMTQIQQAVTQMQTALMTITNTMIELSNRVVVVEKTQQRLLKSAPMTMYYTHSVIPQRAWLHTRIAGGRITSVKVGDIVPNYGQVQKIDDNTGVIVTSSGKEIRYGPYDS